MSKQNKDAKPETPPDPLADLIQPQATPPPDENKVDMDALEQELLQAAAEEPLFDPETLAALSNLAEMEASLLNPASPAAEPDQTAVSHTPDNKTDDPLAALLDEAADAMLRQPATDPLLPLDDGSETAVLPTNEADTPNQDESDAETAVLPTNEADTTNDTETAVAEQTPTNDTEDTPLPTEPAANADDTETDALTALQDSFADTAETDTPTTDETDALAALQESLTDTDEADALAALHTEPPTNTEPAPPTADEIDALAALQDSFANTDETDALATLQETLADSFIPNNPDLNELIATIDKEVEAAHGSGAITDLSSERTTTPLHNRQQYVVFSLAGDTYAAPADHVREVAQLTTVTRIPNVPGWLMGVTNLRGDVLSLIGLRAFLGLGSNGHHHHHSPLGSSYSLGESQVMVVHSEKHASSITTGLVVDEIQDIRYLNTDQIGALSAPIEDQVAPFLQGVYEENGRLLVLLDLEKLLLSPTIWQFDLA